MPRRLTMLDAYRLYPRSKSVGAVETSSPSRDVLSATSSAGTADKTGGFSHRRGSQTSRGCSGNGVKPSLYGYARGTEDFVYNHHKLHAWMYAIKCEDAGRVLESSESEVILSLVKRACSWRFREAGSSGRLGEKGCFNI